MGKVLTPIELGFAELNSLDKARFFLQVAANCFLRQCIRSPASLAGELSQLGKLVRIEMYFHGLSVGVTTEIVKKR